MSVGVVALALARPSGPQRLLSADEDPFTVAAEAVEAVEILPEGQLAAPVGRLWLLGDLPEEAGWMVPELLGRPSIPVVRKGNSREDFWTTVQAIAGHPSSESDDLVVATSEADHPPGEVSAVAVRFRSGRGLIVEAVGTTAPPRTHAVDVATAVRIELRNARVSSSDLPPVVVLDEHRPPGAARTPGTPALSGLAVWAAQQQTGARAVVVDQDPREAAYYADVRVESPVQAVGPWSEPIVKPSAPHAPPTARDSSMLFRVSEGAYVPWPTYRESLPSRWRFEADSCAACGALSFPVRGQCHQCGATDGLTRRPLPRQDLEVAASTVIHPGAQPTEFDPQVSASGPYGVVLVELAPGARATLQFAEPMATSLTPGSRVNTRLRRLYSMEGHWRYGRKAVRTGQ